MAQNQLPPFVALPIQQYIRTELSRRRGDYGISYAPENSEIYNENYKGPQTPWIRCVSNTTIRNKMDNSKKEGFILYGGKSFSEKYGINGKKQVIGYDIKGNPHLIDNKDASQPFRPIPAIKSIDIKIKKDTYRFANIRWDCHSLDQMDYMSYYFFTPKNTILLEWGWNNFDVSSLIDISQRGKFAVFDAITSTYKIVSSEDTLNMKNTDVNPTDNTTQTRGLLDAYSDPWVFDRGTETSGGNYDGMIGAITSFSYSFNESSMTYECTTEISSNSKCYYGLSVRNLTYITDSNNNSTIKVNLNFGDYWQKEFEQDVKSASSNNDIVRGKVSLKGRVFRPSDYFNTRYNMSKVSNSDKTYVTVGLFVELLSQFIPNGTKGKISTINIEDVYIGAHPNMISTNTDILIPNRYSPKVSPTNLLESSSEPPSSVIRKENEKTLQLADRLMISVLNNIDSSGKGQRENLHEILNYKRITAITQQDIQSGVNPHDYAFPYIVDTSDKQYLYKGKLSNLFISTDLIKLICQEADVGDILKALCSKLNEVGKFWQLEVICSDHNIVKIVDTAFTDFQYLLEGKKQLDLSKDERIVYYFDTTSQNSIAKGFKFEVKLSDAIAMSVIMSNQASRLTGSNQVIDNRVVFDVSDNFEVRDIIDENLQVSSQRDTIDKPNGTSLRSMGSGEAYWKGVNDAAQDKFNASHPDLVNDPVKDLGNIDEECMVYHVKNNNAIYLTLPQKYISKYQAMINDNSSAFVNMNSRPIPGTSVEFSLNGIGGFRTFQIFGVKALPKPYRDNIVFKIKEVNQTISDNTWNTTLIAAIIPSKDLQQLI